VADGVVFNAEALVSGCGRGHDMGGLSDPPLEVIGLDIPEVASDLTWMGGVVDFILDYTFLCAIHPDMRDAWAKRMHSLLKDSGLLMVAIFAICNKEGGPPFALSLEGVKDLCEGVGGLRCEELEMLPPELCHASRDGVSNGPLKLAATGVSLWRNKMAESGRRS